jgi:hypothetical protein
MSPQKLLVEIVRRLAALPRKDLGLLGDDIQKEMDPTELFVKCDEFCLALDDPPADDQNETVRAYVHWRKHARMAGCSHGR